ncbi:MAG: GtrA family protein [Sphingomonadales bacterium]|nr:GtrA family protein [Sphingomonadales bacterium]
MAVSLSRARLVELWRYYQAGMVNTAFGLGAYALLVWFGLNIFVAQFVAHFAGVVFNYLTYSRHVFRGASPAKLRFAISYGINYLLGLGTLAIAVKVVTSPYLAGLITAILVSFVNYFILKYFIFLRAKA